MKKLASYDNGNCHVDLYEDGTLERTYDETKPVICDFPSSMDIKITNYCPVGDGVAGPICAYCHEKSTPQGLHGDLNVLLDVLKEIPPGVEIAAGGGSVLSHPNIVPFLQELKHRGLISNITINQKHLAQDKDLILSLIKDDLVKGIGISYTSNTYFDAIKPILQATNNVVFHLIMGINLLKDIDELYLFCREQHKECKILILGYKNFGFGINYLLRHKEIENNKYQWYTKLYSYFKKNDLTISFDNLALTQLNLKRYFTKEAWDRFFLGEDGGHSCYIDAVKQEYAMSSTSIARTSFNDCSLLEFFKRNK